MIQNELKLLLMNQIKGKIFSNESMKKRTTFGVGGKAELYIFPKTLFLRKSASGTRSGIIITSPKRLHFKSRTSFLSK
mgnify:CR=1 FL=1